jgi:hypothetical protein
MNADMDTTGYADDGHAMNERRRLRNSCAWVALALYAWLVYQSGFTNYAAWSVGTCIYVLCVVPMLVWIVKRPYQFPTIETFLLSFLPTYAIPFLTAQNTLVSYDERIVFLAGLYTFLFMAAAGVAYKCTCGHPGRSAWWRQEIITGSVLRTLLGVAAANVVYLIASRFFWNPPAGFAGPLRAASSGMLIVCGFVLGRFWAEGLLSRSQRFGAGLLLAVAFLVQISSLFLVTAASLSMVCILGYASAGKRMPWLLVIMIAVVLAVLHSGKSQMRVKYWEGVTGRQVEFAALPDFFTEWVTVSLTGAPDDASPREKKITRGLLERGSMVHMLCLVVSETPDLRPHLSGATYADLPAQIVPRLFWPGKPTAHVSTSILGIYYGLQREEDTLSTTISFGQISEAYANFGLFGCILLGAIYGFVTRKIMFLTRDSPLLSVPGVLMILYTVWLVDTGQTLSVWTGSLFQAFVGIGVLAVSLRKFVHG